MMVELALNPSETRAVPRKVATKGVLRPVLLAAVGAGALAGVAMAASSVIGDLLPAPGRTSALLKAAAPTIQGGLASQWPDLKDGLPAVVGITVKTVGSAPSTGVEPPRMAALANPAPAIPMASVPASPVPARAMTPAERIPVPTDVATAAPPAPVKLIVPTRTAALLPPRETVRAEDETPPPPVHEAAHSSPKPKAPAEAPRVREATVRPPAPRPAPVAAAPAADKPKKIATAPKPAVHAPGSAKPTVVATAAEPEETNILGVKLPSLAPAGRKIQEGVSALRDAVTNAF